MGEILREAIEANHASKQRPKHMNNETKTAVTPGEAVFNQCMNSYGGILTMKYAEQSLEVQNKCELIAQAAITAHEAAKTIPKEVTEGFADIDAGRTVPMEVPNEEANGKPWRVFSTTSTSSDAFIKTDFKIVKVLEADRAIIVELPDRHEAAKPVCTCDTPLSSPCPIHGFTGDGCAAKPVGGAGGAKGHAMTRTISQEELPLLFVVRGAGGKNTRLCLGWFDGKMLLASPSGLVEARTLEEFREINAEYADPRDEVRHSLVWKKFEVDL